MDMEAAYGATLDRLLDQSSFHDLAESSSAFMSLSPCRRVMYIGSDSADKVESAIKKLDTLYTYSVGSPTPQHTELLGCMLTPLLRSAGQLASSTS